MSTDDEWQARAGQLLDTTVDVAVVAGKATAMVAKLFAVGAAIAVAYLSDAERRARARRWLLLGGDRWRIAGGFVLVVFVATLCLAMGDVIGVSQPGFVTTMFSGIISGLFSFVPIVITVNQLAVSQLFGSPAELRAEVESVDGLRSTIERLHPADGKSSTEPAAFLRRAFETVADRADALEAAVDDGETMAQLSADVYLEVVREQCEHVAATLPEGNPPLIEVLVPMLGDSYSRALNDTRRLRSSFVDLSPDAMAVLDDFETLFVELDVLRQYFKSLFIQQELSYLSRMVAYTGVGTFVVAAGVVMVFANGQPLPNHPFVLDVLMSAAIALSFLPFAVLASFVMRVAIIAQRTAASGTFTPDRETDEFARHR